MTVYRLPNGKIMRLASGRVLQVAQPVGTVTPPQAVATKFSVSVSPASGAVGTATVVTYTPVDGAWPVNVTLTPTTNVPGSFTPATIKPTGFNPATVSFTSSAAAVGVFGANVIGVTSTGNATYTATVALSAPIIAGLSSTATTSSAASLTWTEGGTVTTRKVEIRTPSDPTDAAAFTTAQGSFTATGGTVTGLSAGTYDFRVTVTNAAGSNSAKLSNITISISSTQTAAPPLTGINFYQPMPIHPLTNDKGVVGWADPVGGIGPYIWSVVGSTAYVFDALTGAVPGRLLSGYYPVGATPDTITLQCKDGRGAIAQQVVTITKVTDTGQGYIWYNDRVTLPNDQLNIQSLAWQVQAVGNGHTIAGDTVSVFNTDGTASTLFAPLFGSIRTKSTTQAPGTYQQIVKCTSTTGNVLSVPATFTIVPYTPIATIEWTQPTVSTSMLAGSAIGTALATTPNNNPKWSLTDPTGTLAIDATRGLLTLLKSPTLGDLVFSITCTDVLATLTKSFTLHVVQGTVIAPTRMTMTVAPLTNAFVYATASRPAREVGQPVVSGSPFTGPVSWSMTQTNFNPNSQLGSDRSLPKYALDPATGHVTAVGILSYQGEGGWPDDVLTISATDGINTCTQSFTIPVTKAPAAPPIYVGRGMSTSLPAGAPAGSVGYEHFADALFKVNALNNINNPSMQSVTIEMYGDADPDYYTWDNGHFSAQAGTLAYVSCPLTINCHTVNGNPVRIGGPRTNIVGGYGPSAKGILSFANGDLVINGPMIVNYGHGANLTSGVAGIYRQYMGNTVLRKVWMNNCDNGFESGNIPGNIRFENCEFSNTGTELYGQGQTHGAYVGMCNQLDVVNCWFWHAMAGHMLKTRACVTNITNSWFRDDIGGKCANPISFSNGGAATITNSRIRKGVMPVNPYAINFCDDVEFLGPGFGQTISQPPGIPWPVFHLEIQNSIIEVMGWGNNHSGNPSAVNMYVQSAVNNSAHLQNCQIYLSPWANFTTTRGTNQVLVANKITDDGTTYLTAPLPWNDSVRPTGLPGAMPVEERYFHVSQYTGDDYKNFNDVQIKPNKNEYRVSHTAAVGTIIDTLEATGGPYFLSTTPQPDARENPFGVGTTYTFFDGGTYYPFTTNPPWTNRARYKLNARSDGKVDLAIAQTLTAGVDGFVIRATGPTGTICDNFFYVIVT